MDKIIDIGKVILNKQLTKDIYKMVIESDLTKQIKKPGQFVNLKIDKEGLILRRPISISEIDYANNQFTLIYKVVGKGTNVLVNYKINQSIDVMGPLGNGFDINSISENQTALIVGGGVGIPPLYELTKQLKNKNVNVITVLGFNSKDDLFLINEFKKISKVYITTMDGSIGYKGTTIDLINHLINKHNLDFDKYYSCGPTPMLKGLTQLFENKKGYISIEKRMACGSGVCYACVVKIKTKNENDKNYSRVCKDGPVYESDLIEW